MALGNNNTNNNNLYILKVKTKDAEKKEVPPYFSVAHKVDEKWSEKDRVTKVLGTLTKIVCEKAEWEGTEYHVVKVYLNDDAAAETYLVDLRMNLISRNIFNTFLGLKSFENISLSLYESNKDGKKYPAVAVRQNDEKTEWKYKISELPPIEKVTVGKKVVTDSTALDEFFIEKLEALGEKLAKSQPKAPVAPAQEASGGEVVDAAADVPEDDIPF